MGQPPSGYPSWAAAVSAAPRVRTAPRPQVGSRHNECLDQRLPNAVARNGGTRKRRQLSLVPPSEEWVSRIAFAGTVQGCPGSALAMLDLVDLLLVRRGIAQDDCSLAFRRVDGNLKSKVVYFLPLQTSFAVARQAGFLPLDFLAAYEMPNAIASSEPDLCLQAMLALTNDAQQLLSGNQVAAHDAVIVGLSAGSYPATYLANRIGARLCSVASADRVDLLIWESPAARTIRRRAAQKGYAV